MPGNPSLPVVVVVGLGPGAPELATAGTLAAIERVPHRFLRTARHPAAHLVPGAATFDHRYDAAERIEEVYPAIVDDLVAAAERHRSVLYAVPGSPRVLERSVELLAADARVVADIVPAMSFLDLAWVRLGIDPVEVGARLVDGHRFAESAAGERGPLLVAHCHNRRVLSDIKLAYDDPPACAVVLQRLGLPDERVVELGWADLDRAIEPDHLTAIWIPEAGRGVAHELVRFHELVRTLRSECPWDREQTHASLSRHLLEEAYEVLEAVDHLDPEAGGGFGALEEELGDLLFQVVFHSVLAAEAGRFDLADVARGIHDKLHARHPHVFGDDAVASVEDLAASWERRKVLEKGRASVMDGIPAALPALLLASKIQRKAASQGVDWRDLDDTEGVARRLLEAVDAARAEGIDPESELRAAAVRIRDRYRAAESSGP